MSDENDPARITRSFYPAPQRSSRSDGGGRQIEAPVPRPTHRSTELRRPRVDDHYAARPRTRKRRRWLPQRSPELTAIGFAAVLFGIGAFLYFVVLDQDLPGSDSAAVDEAASPSTGTDEGDGTGAAGDGTDDGAAGDGTDDGAAGDGTGDAAADEGSSDADGSVGSTDGEQEVSDGTATAGGGGDGDGATDGESSEAETDDGSTTSTSEPETTTVPPSLTPDIDGVLDTDGIVLTGSVPSEEGLDRLVATLTVLSGPGGLVDASEVTVDPTAPPVRQVALSVSDRIGFSVNSETIEADFLPILDRVVELMQADQMITVAVLGHTDADGVDFENLALSQRRAEAVVDYLADQGVNRFRLEPSGRGSTEPIAPNDTAEGRALNRRIEFTIFGLTIG
ncbi:MAG: OmpA family protein [Actinomycetota bacterium]